VGVAQPGLLAVRLASLSLSSEGRLQVVVRLRAPAAAPLLLLSIPNTTSVLSRSCVVQ
jgi:hypothetical protein